MKDDDLIDEIYLKRNFSKEWKKSSEYYNGSGKIVWMKYIQRINYSDLVCCLYIPDDNYFSAYEAGMGSDKRVRIVLFCDSYKEANRLSNLIVNAPQR